MTRGACNDVVGWMTGRGGLALAIALLLAAAPTEAKDRAPAKPSPDVRAAATEAKMTPEERVVLTSGFMPIALMGNTPPIPKDAITSAGYVAGIPRLGVPSLRETDAGLGVAYILRLREATALPASILLGATWNPELARRGGAMIGSEARAMGFNVLLAGGMNLIREPRNGRTFEYISEDPLHSGIMAGAGIAGIQSNGIISTMKHFALNAQETGRSEIDVRISEAAARESDLLAFQIAIERGNPLAVMCAYNLVNGVHACHNDWLLNTVLKRDWGYKGFVMSDWGAVKGVDAALGGLDQQSGSQLDRKFFFGKPLAEVAATDPRYAGRLRDMNIRILRSIYAAGLDTNPPAVKPIDFDADAAVAEATAKEGIVVLRNRSNVLPLTAAAKRVAVIGGYADSGVLSGGGSSQVMGKGGPAIIVQAGGTGPFAKFTGQLYHPSSPLEALRKRGTGTTFTFNDGRYIANAVKAAQNADVAIVFATQWREETNDIPDLNLTQGQDDLIAAVAAANPNTIVVLESGGAVMMPWLDQTAAVVAAWYPGARGGQAIAAVLYGDTNPSGRLPITFPASIDQLPLPKLPGSDWVQPKPFAQRPVFAANYDIDGSDVGYRWYARTGAKPLFPFGFGLSYTSFAHSGLKVKAGKTTTATFTVTNTGARAGADVPQLYLVSAAGKPTLRLAAFDKIELAPGASRTVTVTIDPRLIARWKDGGWQIAGGSYGFALGKSASDLGPVTQVTLAARRWGP